MSLMMGLLGLYCFILFLRETCFFCCFCFFAVYCFACLFLFIGGTELIVYKLKYERLNFVSYHVHGLNHPIKRKKILN